MSDDTQMDSAAKLIRELTCAIDKAGREREAIAMMLKNNTAVLKLAEGCIELALVEFEEVQTRCDAWRGCAGRLATRLAAARGYCGAGIEEGEALAEFEKLKGKL